MLATGYLFIDNGKGIDKYVSDRMSALRKINGHPPHLLLLSENPGYPGELA
jgi:hypothetical protein